MKKIIFSVLLLLSVLPAAKAQVSLQINIGEQPVWGPVGYDHVDYYYIPDADAYYDVPHRQYVYYDNRTWVRSGELPPQYRDIDIYRVHKVVVNERDPWMYNDRYRQQYTQYRGKYDQHPIRDSREERYWANPGHPEHGKWHGNDGRDNGRHEGELHDNERRGEGRHDNGNHGNSDHGRGEGHGRKER